MVDIPPDSDEPLSLANPVKLMRQMSHDMRSPLNAIGGTCGLLAEGGYGALSPAQLRALQRVQRNSDRLLIILDDLMTYVKAEGDAYPLEPKAFSPVSFLTTLLAPAQAGAQNKGLAFHLALDGPFPDAASGDTGVLQRIILALVWNAVSFTIEGEVKVTSRWLPDHSWEILVKDSGPGIPQAAIKRVFEPFWRGDAEKSPVPTSGCGLGLAMAAALTRLLKGTLSVAETSPAGSTFYVALPLSAV